MPQRKHSTVTVRLGNLPTTPMAARAFNGTLHRDNELSSLIDLYLFDLDPRNIQRDLKCLSQCSYLSLMKIHNSLFAL